MLTTSTSHELYPVYSSITDNVSYLEYFAKRCQLFFGSIRLALSLSSSARTNTFGTFLPPSRHFSPAWCIRPRSLGGLTPAHSYYVSASHGGAVYIRPKPPHVDKSVGPVQIFPVTPSLVRVWILGTATMILS